MDPVSIIGLASSVVGIVDVIAKNVKFLRGLQSKYRQTDLTVSLIIGQLSTLKAALNQISEWIDSELATPQHEQLVEDLTVALQGCQVLIFVLDTRVDELHRDDTTKKISTFGKIEFLWDESGMKEYLNHLNNQINALNLLLTAIQCRSTFEQKNLLDSGESRRLMALVEEDTSSLLISRDADSICSGRSVLTQNSKLLDVIFDFDREIFNSKAYRGALRSSMVQVLSRKRKTGVTITKPVTRSTGRLDGMEIEIHTERDENELEDCVDSLAPAVTVTSRERQVTFSEPGTDKCLEIAQGEGALESSHTASDKSHNEHEVESPFDRNGSNARERLSSNTGLLPSSMSNGSVSKTSKRLSFTGKQIVNSLRKYRSGYAMPIRHSVTESSAPEMSESSECKVLILGVCESGKSTLLESMKMAALKPSSPMKLSESPGIPCDWKEIILRNMLSNVNLIIDIMDSLESDNFKSRQIDTWDIALFSNPQFVRETGRFWKSPAVQKIYQGCEELWGNSLLRDNTAYFFDSMQRISNRDYIPSPPDVFRARLETSVIAETCFEANDITYKAVDVGGARSDFKRWVNVFGHVNVMVYTVDITGYNKRLYEKRQGTCMSESLRFFKSLVLSRRTNQTHIILIFTNSDKLAPELKTSPLEDMFPDYTHGPNVEAARLHIAEQFLVLVPKAKLPVCVNYTSIVADETSMGTVVFAGIRHLTKKSTAYSPLSYFVLDGNGTVESLHYRSAFSDGAKGSDRPLARGEFDQISRSTFLLS